MYSYNSTLPNNSLSSGLRFCKCLLCLRAFIFVYYNNNAHIFFYLFSELTATLRENENALHLSVVVGCN